MSQQPKGQRVQNFNHLTERLRRGRIRIRHEYIPEIAAYIWMLAKRYERMALGARAVVKDTKDARLLQTIAYVNTVIQTLQTILDGLCDGFDGDGWNEAANHISTQLGIEIGKPLPQEFEVFEKVKLPRAKE